jgi:hypothetical protein
VGLVPFGRFLPLERDTRPWPGERWFLPKIDSSLENLEREAKPQALRPMPSGERLFVPSVEIMKGVPMNMTDRKLSRTGQRPFALPVLVSALTLSLMFASGCSSMCRRHESASRVLESQNAMLEKVKLERSDARVSSKVKADPDLKEAEEHLNMAIELLMNSNEAVKASL